MKKSSADGQADGSGAVPGQHGRARRVCLSVCRGVLFFSFFLREVRFSFLTRPHNRSDGFRPFYCSLQHTSNERRLGRRYYKLVLRGPTRKTQLLESLVTCYRVCVCALRVELRLD
ncbi:hypothetical protein BDA96_09G230200 [Sorghum bicolor]|jgi:hypothetical protein|uniref:Uncharacterized protein n=2 Tax=Sorghum bicolor TaxID=4558 RepID=A0A921QBU6_SORBI|nr:hypothetical protein BDA96_09G230200 [Sorghum bicolor]OQU78382.1 hypothetical protein SORBI_3009G217450 [Sorghum bicolor]